MGARETGSPGFLCERAREEESPLRGITIRCATLICRQQQLMQHLIIRVRLPCHAHYICLCFVLFCFFFLAVLYSICLIYIYSTPAISISHSHVDASPCSLSQVHSAPEFNANKLVLLPLVVFFFCGGKHVLLLLVFQTMQLETCP